MTPAPTASNINNRQQVWQLVIIYTSCPSPRLHQPAYFYKTLVKTLWTDLHLITDSCSRGQECCVLVQSFRTAGLEAVLDIVVLSARQVAVEKSRDLPSEDPVHTLLFTPHQTLEETLPVYPWAPRTLAPSSAVNINSQWSDVLIWSPPDTQQITGASLYSILSSSLDTSHYTVFLIINQFYISVG